MRQKRAKAYRKLMHVYSMSFGFRQPYQVLGMSTFAPLRQLRINELVTYSRFRNVQIGPRAKP